MGATAVDPDDSLLIEIEEDRPPEASAAPHLHLEQPLGRGAMGEVWLARDDRLARKVALKLLGARLAHDERARQRFVDEARATAQLAHPGIVPVHEIGTWSDGRPYYTMEVIRGETFGRRIEAHHRAGALPDELHHLVDHLRRACEAVGYAHARGVVHRELKPDNLLIGDFGQVLVVDWGLVRADPDAHEPVRTDRPPDLTHGPAGTPRYMSPEQVLGLPIGPRSDVFSLGAILVLLLEGRPAFPQDSLPGVLDAVAGGRAALPTRGPEALRSIAE
ncbi:MAG: serine/threonine protein kinase, partial [Myxococcales bacterium]|nr:serine/threonine protein kinase [Myxococcales bacterium]